MPVDDAKYCPQPSKSIYTKGNRYGFIKEDHKAILHQIHQSKSTDDDFSLIDFGCGNGELLYLIREHFPKAKLFGIDSCREFIETGRNKRELESVELQHKDIFKETRNFDIVVSDGVINIFQDCMPFLSKAIESCAQYGTICILGLFNKFDIDIQVAFKDYTDESMADIWQMGFAQHSQKRISLFLKEKVESFSFTPVEMGVDIEHDTNSPIRAWTFKDEQGQRRITNATNLLLNKHLLSISK